MRAMVQYYKWFIRLNNDFFMSHLFPNKDFNFIFIF